MFHENHIFPTTSSCVLSITLRGERLLHVHRNRDNTVTHQIALASTLGFPCIPFTTCELRTTSKFVFLQSTREPASNCFRQCSILPKRLSSWERRATRSLFFQRQSRNTHPAGACTFACFTFIAASAKSRKPLPRAIGSRAIRDRHLFSIDRYRETANAKPDNMWRSVKPTNHAV